MIDVVKHTRAHSPMMNRSCTNATAPQRTKVDTVLIVAGDQATAVFIQSVTLLQTNAVVQIGIAVQLHLHPLLFTPLIMSNAHHNTTKYECTNILFDAVIWHLMHVNSDRRITRTVVQMWKL